MSNLVTYINEIIGEITNPPQKEKAVIKVNNTTIILTYRDTTQINASIEKGDGIIKYEIIEGENAITVSETGLIKGVEPGKAKIRVSMDATENYEAADDIIIEVIVTEIV